MPCSAGPDAGRLALSSSPATTPDGAAGFRGWRDVLGQAFHALCKSRADAGPDHDIWHLRHHWLQIRGPVGAALRRGTFRFSPVRLIDLKNGHRCVRDV